MSEESRTDVRTGLRVIKHPLTHSLDTREGMHNDDAGSLRSHSPPPRAFRKGGRINLESGELMFHLWLRVLITGCKAVL